MPATVTAVEALLTVTDSRPSIRAFHAMSLADVRQFEVQLLQSCFHDCHPYLRSPFIDFDLYGLAALDLAKRDTKHITIRTFG